MTIAATPWVPTLVIQLSSKHGAYANTFFVAKIPPGAQRLGKQPKRQGQKPNIEHLFRRRDGKASVLMSFIALPASDAKARLVITLHKIKW